MVEADDSDEFRECPSFIFRLCRISLKARTSLAGWRHHCLSGVIIRRQATLCTTMFLKATDKHIHTHTRKQTYRTFCFARFEVATFRYPAHSKNRSTSNLKVFVPDARVSDWFELDFIVCEIIKEWTMWIRWMTYQRHTFVISLTFSLIISYRRDTSPVAPLLIRTRLIDAKF